MLVMGLVFAFIGAAFLLDTIRAVSDGVETNGVVVALSPSSDGDTFAPVIEFAARDGEVYRFTSNIFRSPAPDVGGTIGVLYDPDDPTDATENSRGFLWIFPLVFLAVGLVFLAAGIWTFSRRVAAAGRLNRETRRVIVPGSTAETMPPPVPSENEPIPEPPGDRPATAQFRRVEPRGPDSEGRFEFRIVARTPDGAVHYSDWLDVDPTTDVITNDLAELPLEWRGDRSKVVWVSE